MRSQLHSRSSRVPQVDATSLCRAWQAVTAASSMVVVRRLCSFLIIPPRRRHVHRNHHLSRAGTITRRVSASAASARESKMNIREKRLRPPRPLNSVWKHALCWCIMCEFLWVRKYPCKRAGGPLGIAVIAVARSGADGDTMNY
jgi:hypothetical protein